MSKSMIDLNRRELLALGGAGALSLGLSPIGGNRAMAQDATPKKGGHVKIGLSGASTSDSIDPQTWSSSFNQIGLWSGVYNNLTEVDVDGNIIPELAESFEPSADAKTWVFKLRPDATFSNGKAVDADDVIASFNHHRGANSKSAAKGIVEAITDIKADGKNTVIFTLKDGNADFPFVVNDYHLVIMQTKDGKADWQSVIGTAGYTLVSNEPGVNLKMTRRDGYFKPDKANFQDVELVSIADGTARQTALMTGAVDVISRVAPATVHLLKRNPNIVIEEVTGTQQFTMPMFTDTDPFKSNDVRLALKYAIDREACVNTILSGHGRVGNDTPIAPANRYFASDLEQRKYDPDKAKYHLKKAGLDTLKVDLHAADAAFVGAVNTAVLFKEHAAKAGIDVNVVREPDDGYWSNIWLKKPFVMCYWGGRPTEDAMFSLAYSADAPWNDTHWKNPRFNELLIAARAELDETKRPQMYHEMQSLVRDDGGVIVPMFANYIDARSTKLAHGPKIASNWELDGWKIVERWWMA